MQQAAQGLLVLDLDFDPTQTGGLNTSHARRVWHTTLAANLLQFPDITSVELRLNGSCDDYATVFESDVCARLEAGILPWNRQP